ncbi:MAG TPA: DUF5655 domain-containing protein [Pantanalinema sp.]
MSDLKLFRYDEQSATALPGDARPIEKSLQKLIESQMETFLGVRCLASEYSTGKTHKGRIDSLGLDENGCPVIIEYKRHINENVINQGLFYLDWLLDHQAEFRWLVMEQLNKEDANNIQWQGTRLLCIAADFTKYDEHAVAQINRNIELIRYKLFGPDLLLLELVNAVSGPSTALTTTNTSEPELEPVVTSEKSTTKTNAQQIGSASPALRGLLEQMESFITSLGDDVQVNPLKLYTAYRRLRNFACSTVVPKQDARILLWLSIDPASVQLEEGFTRDVSNIGHWGTGNLEVSIRDERSLEKAKALILRCYQES